MFIQIGSHFTSLFNVKDMLIVIMDNNIVLQDVKQNKDKLIK